jgi:oligopeptide/dipeptide ABC transporter ATP-binding protein
VRHISDRVAVMYLGKLAELADARDLYVAPKHPYTGALLSAVPIANPRLGRTRSTFVLGGDVPNPINPPTGCRFHPRCPRAADVCAENDPPLAPLAAGHEAACFFPLEKWPLTDAEMRRDGELVRVPAADPDPPPVDVGVPR